MNRRVPWSGRAALAALPTLVAAAILCLMAAPALAAGGGGEASLVLVALHPDGQLALDHVQRRPWGALLRQCPADRRDLGRSRSAAASDHPGTEIARVRGELGEVLGRRVRIDDSAPGHARQADVGHGGQR